MIKAGEDELKCDLAETYGIYDMRSLPIRTVATFSAGLSDDSRIKLKMSGRKATTEVMILSAIYDRVTTLLWFNSEEGQRGENRPKSMLAQLMGIEEEKDTAGFDTAEDYEQTRKKLLGGAV